MTRPLAAAVTYLVPVRASRPDPDLVRYLHEVSTWCPLVVVDGSDPAVWRWFDDALRGVGRHLAPATRTANGKVAGVCTGMRVARTPWVVVADDDVRYDRASFDAVLARCTVGTGVVLPQNVFSRWCWHTRWDTARSLVNRGIGGDFPGTMAVRLDALPGRTYDGDVLFENLELVRTVRAAGADVVRADDVFVARVPPTTRHFLGQRVRQAYDSSAQPARLVLELALLPLWCRAPGRVALAATALAALGRLRHGGREAFPLAAVAWAPAWTAERAVCAWLAVGLRVFRGGVPYSGGRLRCSAHRTRTLRRRVGARGSPAVAA